MPNSRPSQAPRSETADAIDPLFADHHVLLIGISSYEAGERINFTLKGSPGTAARDAETLKETLEFIGYPRSQIHCLCNKKASFKNIKDKLEELTSLWRVRLLLLVWAGHGVFRRSQRKSFLLPYDADLDDLECTAFPVDKVIQQIKSAKADNKAIFLDTCHSAPKSDRVFLPEWERLELVSADPTLTFVGASTYLALEQAGHGGILTSCLKEAFSGRDAVLCDPEGAVHLDDVVIYLQRHLVRRAIAAWEEAGKKGLVPQFPYIVRQLGDSVPVGRNVTLHLQSFIDSCQLAEPLKKLATMVIGSIGVETAGDDTTS